MASFTHSQQGLGSQFEVCPSMLLECLDVAENGVMNVKGSKLWSGLL